MFREESEDKMQRRADILFPTMKDKKEKVTLEKENNKKIPGLGVSKFDFDKDDNDEDITNSKKQDNKEWAEILADYVNKQKKESREDILYTTMNNKEDKDNKEAIFDKLKSNKKVDKGHITGAAANLDKTNIEYVKNLKETDSLKKLENNESIKFDQNLQYKSLEEKIKEHKLKNKLAVEHIDNKYIKNHAIKHYGKEAAENLHMSKANSYMNTEYAKEHTIYENCRELEPNLRSYFEKKIKSQIGEDKINSTKGIYIDSNSTSSKDMAQSLANNEEFMQEVAKVRKSLEVGNSVNTTITFKDTNFQLAIGKADIRNMHINKDGNIDLLVTDVYDFNKNDPRDLVQVGRDRQEKGEIKPYFIMYHVIIPKTSKLK